MFAYCGNNPVSRYDPTGRSWWTDFWGDVRKRLEDEKKIAAVSDDGTITIGGIVNADLGISAGLSVGITADNKGNIGLIGTINAGGGFPSAGIGFYTTYTNAPTIYMQEGLGTAIGGSGGPFVVAVGAEYNTLIDQEEGQAYHGGTFSATVGLYPTVVELHGEVGYTDVIGINIYDLAISIVDFISGN